MARLISRLLVIIGVLMLGWCALVLIDAGMAQWLARESLDIAVSQSETSAPGRGPAGPPALTIPKAPPMRGEALAALSIPRVHLSAVVLHGSDSRTLRRGPGHLENTPLPGERGNVVIAGHRDTFFLPLAQVKHGDDVFLDTPDGRVHYRVDWMRVVKPSDLSVIAPTDAAALTLITCYPFWVWGNAPDRYIVRASRVDDQGAVATSGTISHAFIDVPHVAPARAASAVTRPRAPVHHVVDDATLVRDAVGRFRVAYNARLQSHADAPGGAPLTFGECDISVNGDAATAACAAGASSNGATMWTFTLERADTAWAIRSVVRN